MFDSYKIAVEMMKQVEQVLPGSRIGDEIAKGSFGTTVKVYDKNSALYTLKLVVYKKPQYVHEKTKLKREIDIGLLKNVRQFGVKVHHYKINNKFGWYIMDHFNYKYKNAIVLSLNEYSSYGNIDHIFPLLYKKLIKFYQITKGYHGDLHTENIVVLLDPASKDVIDIIIFDYGAHVKLQKFTKRQTLSEYLDNINHNFKTRKNLEFYNYKNNVMLKGARVYGNQLLRSNKNMIYLEKMYGIPPAFGRYVKHINR